MPGCHEFTPPPSPPSPRRWTVPEAQAVLGELAFQCLAMVDSLNRINAGLLLLLPPEPELTDMLEDHICPSLAVDISGCIECITNDSLLQVVEALQRAADVSVEQLEQDFLARKRGGSR